MSNYLKPARLGIGIISAGKVGAVLGAALTSAGHAIVGVYAKSEESQERARTLLPQAPLMEIPQIVEKSEVILLAVPDDALAPLVAWIAEHTPLQSGQIILHTSGRYGVGILKPATDKGAIGLAIHPAMTFTGLSLDLARLHNTSFGVSGAAPFLPIAQALAVEMGGEPVIIAEGDRPLYHAALAHASNHLVTITGQSMQILASLGIENPARYLEPLVRASLDNALASGESALTGPVVRGDSQTVEAHTEVLHGFAVEENAQDIEVAYRALARATAQRAHAHQALNDEQYARIIDALDS
ncbi:MULTISPECIES: Rossmann-like and DUF2520 domain-containing protein [unclassified Rothia (in: high G+C Gram-positive bacteria)]|uniref:Rossmann-like and DUF2520 domain-containing protein n=1 Tax=unclassified Rothia (in: high G+C Gram-positive bacteria) TaxID=2689056 RepID=UPI001956F7D0|nr:MULTISPECIES: DUF2520 domain-containing protein [unclassified Rothia (in: high G+C Gram-positive bacteria)]MBM7051608.1 DUF2520 domain-containing protein [Rothia sp. ZJ1223]QRZ61757.1 DUF2520 domain-containing protein [Rothia sp. ZJ932]